MPRSAGLLGFLSSIFPSSASISSEFLASTAMTSTFVLLAAPLDSFQSAVRRAITLLVQNVHSFERWDCRQEASETIGWPLTSSCGEAGNIRGVETLSQTG